MTVVVEERVTEQPVARAADPAPLGLAGFALTTFLLSGHNANFIPDVIWLGPALFYGGVAQLLAGMWEFKNRNVFGATAFTTYGAFWLSLGAFVVIISTTNLGTGLDVHSSEAWFLFSFAIFNSYMLLWAMRVNVAVFMVFLTLEITEILLAIGNLKVAHGHSDHLVHLGGWFGVATAAVAWYTSAAAVGRDMPDGGLLPMGNQIHSLTITRRV
jgi:hypothetical protein